MDCIGSRDFRKQTKLPPNYNEVPYLRKSPIRRCLKGILKVYDHFHVGCGPIIFILKHTNCDKKTTILGSGQGTALKNKNIPTPCSKWSAPAGLCSIKAHTKWFPWAHISRKCFLIIQQLKAFVSVRLKYYIKHGWGKQFWDLIGLRI